MLTVVNLEDVIDLGVVEDDFFFIRNNDAIVMSPY